MRDILKSGLAQLGIEPHGQALERFELYYRLLTERNKVMNLTAISGPEDTARLHFLDSAALLGFGEFAGATVIDVGAGAGFPGLPMKICAPRMRLTLLDSLGKRVDFLRELCGELRLEGVDCIHARAEESGEFRESFDFAVSRAMARLNMLVELCLPFVRVGGAMLAMKGAEAQVEAAQAGQAIALLGGSIERVEEYHIPGAELCRRVIVIRKERPTPEKYPRRFAKIQRDPL